MKHIQLLAGLTALANSNVEMHLSETEGGYVVTAWIDGQRRMFVRPLLADALEVAIVESPQAFQNAQQAMEMPDAEYSSARAGLIEWRDEQKKIIEQMLSTKQPMQPVFRDAKGVIRFKKNHIVEHILDNGNIDMNALAMMEFPVEDREQFAQLIGYSVDGFGSLSYATDETRTIVESAALHLAPDAPAEVPTAPKGETFNVDAYASITNPAPAAGHTKDSMTAALTHLKEQHGASTAKSIIRVLGHEKMSEIPPYLYAEATHLAENFDPDARKPVTFSKRQNLVEKMTMHLLGKVVDPAPGVNWQCARAWRVNDVRKLIAEVLDNDTVDNGIITMKHQRDVLGKAIADAAIKAKIANQDAVLEGPHLIMLVNDMAECIVSQEGIAGALAAVLQVLGAPDTGDLVADAKAAIRLARATAVKAAPPVPDAVSFMAKTNTIPKWDDMDGQLAPTAGLGTNLSWQPDGIRECKINYHTASTAIPVEIYEALPKFSTLDHMCGMKPGRCWLTPQKGTEEWLLNWYDAENRHKQSIAKKVVLSSSGNGL